MKKAEFGQLPMPVQDYLLYLEAIKGHSELSVIEYASDLRTFFRYLAKEKKSVSAWHAGRSNGSTANQYGLYQDHYTERRLPVFNLLQEPTRQRRSHASAACDRHTALFYLFNGQPALAGGKSNESAGRAENKKKPFQSTWPWKKHATYYLL